jgi:hypothetical protein
MNFLSRQVKPLGLKMLQTGHKQRRDASFVRSGHQWAGMFEGAACVACLPLCDDILIALNAAP